MTITSRTPGFRLKVAVAFILNAMGIVRVCRYLNRRKAKILLYHGVIPEPVRGMLNSEGLHVPARQFEQQIAYVARHYHLMPLGELVDRLRRRDPLPDYTVALTFDDGYLNTYQHAVPVLERYRAPATFFVTTSFVSSRELLPLDQLEYLIHATCKASVTLQVNGSPQTWPLTSDGDRRAALYQLKRRVRVLPEAQAADALRNLAQQLDVTGSPQAGYYCTPLTWDLVREMASRERLTIGSHAVHHLNLETLDRARLREELTVSRAVLQERLRRPVEGIAYPGGTFTDDIKQMARDAGYRYGLTTRHGFNDAETDVFELRRNEVANEGNLALFKAAVSGTLDACKTLLRGGQ